MEYENLKHLQKKDEFVADTDTTDALSQQPIQTERADSFSSTHSASYQILFHPEDDGVETHHDLKEGSLEEVQEEPPTADLDSAVYSHPQSVRLRSPERGEDGEGYTKVHVSSEMSQSIYQIPNAPTQPLSVELPPNSTSAVIDNSSREFTIQVTDNSTGEFTMQATNTAAPSLPVRRISDSVVSVQHAIGHPVAKKSLSVSSGTRGGSGFQTEPINSVAAKPLIMKVLPLYLCMGDGKVYADKNAASIPTHHLVEVMGLEKSIALQEINNQLPPIPTVS